ncbi:MAG: adenosylhomocysteinase [Actinomycetes bacterium]
MDLTDPGLAPEGARRVAWAERAMPVLGRIAARFAAERPLEGLRVAASLHVTTETAVLVRTLLAGGARVALAASNPLATQDDVAASLAADGADVFARHRADPVTYARHLHAALDTGPDLLLDDGCDLVTTLHAARPELVTSVRGGCEETRTGAIRLRQMAQDGALRIPVLAVSETDTTRLVADQYGTGQSVLDAVVRATHALLAGRTVVVAGFGPAGRGIADRAAGLGARVVVTEVDATRALEATLQGYQVLPMGEAAPLADVVVTATGNRGVVRAEHFGVLADGAVLVNAGHFDVEVDVDALREASVAVEQGVRPFADAYVMPDGRRLVLLAGGQVANLAVAEGSPPAVMDVAFGVQAVAAAWLAAHGGDLGPGVHAVPAAIDREVAGLALEALGVRLDVLDPAQERYRTAWQSAR